MHVANFLAMGTRCQVILPGIDPEDGDRILAGIRQDIQRVESRLSRYLPDSDLSRINRYAADSPVALDEEMVSILRTCRDAHAATGGAFDIAYRSSSRMDHVHLDEAAMTVRFDDDRVELDLGGFGKGYALAQVEKRLKRHLIADAFISFGESSILTLGRHPAGDCWKLGLARTTSTGASAHVFFLNDGSVSVSSNSRIDDAGGVVTRHHVVNPASGQPVDEHITIGVRSASAVEAEILSTACLSMSDAQLAALKPRFPDAEIVKITFGPAEPTVLIL